MDRSIEVAQFIVDEFAPDIAAYELDPGYDLLENGIVDSLGVLTVLAWVEDRFGVTIDVGEIDEDDFRSVRAICALAGSAERAPQGTLS
jgi:acyl carrier protein